MYQMKTFLILCLAAMCVLASAEICNTDWSLYVLIGGYRKQCEIDGRWVSPQCWGSVGKCWCVNRTTGSPIDAGYRLNETNQLVCP